MSCRVEGCEAELVKHQNAHGYCATHYKRWKRGGDLAAPVQERLERIQRAEEASISLADADPEDDGDYDRRKANWKAAIGRYRDPLVMREQGKLGGEARAKNLTAERRAEIARIAGIAKAQKLTKEERGRLARLAAQARWKHSQRMPAYRQASMRKLPREPEHRPTEPQPPVKR